MGAALTSGQQYNNRWKRHTQLLVCSALSGFILWRKLSGLVSTRGLVSENFDQLSMAGKILDYLWHGAPVTALVIGGFASLFLTKNSFLDQINQQYVLTARAKGLAESRVLYGHVFRNAMLIVIAGFSWRLRRYIVHQLSIN